MNILSFEYLVLLLVSVIVYYIFPKKYQWTVLLAASIVFYVLAATPYTIIYVIVSALITYFCSIYISKNRESNRKLALTLSIISIVLVVAFWMVFKCYDLWKLIIPINLGIVAAFGMSYYTLLIISYVVDCYKGKIVANKNPFKLLLFICFFPPLTTGPISRYDQLESLFEGHSFSYTRITSGAQRILWGFAKKLILGERLAIIINSVPAANYEYGSIWQAVAMLLFPFQLYADFSGSMDIVIGTAELFGITLPENFVAPFKSRTIKELWQRWHITLGGFFKEYVYFPLGGSRKGKVRKYINICIVFTLSALWHNFTLGFVVWGLMQAFYQLMEELLAGPCNKLAKLLDFKTDSFGWHFFQSARTYILYAISMSVFRIGIKNTLDSFKRIFTSGELSVWQLFDGTYQNMGLRALDLNAIVIMTALLIIGYAIKCKSDSLRGWIANQPVVFRWIIWFALIYGVIIFGIYGPGYEISSFIYGGF